MIFAQELVIPKETTQGEPVIERLKIAQGIITEIKVRPRAGHRWLAHCTISHHGHQIAPSTEAVDLHGEFFPIDWGEYYEIYQPPYELVVKGWNEDDTYSHTFDIFIVVLPRKAVITYAIVDAIKGLFGGLSPKRIYTAMKGNSEDG